MFSSSNAGRRPAIVIEIFCGFSQKTTTLKVLNSRLLQILKTVNVNCVGLNVVRETVSFYTRVCGIHM